MHDNKINSNNNVYRQENKSDLSTQTNHEHEKTINAETLNIDATLQDITSQLRDVDVLILDVGNNFYNQTDAIYDNLVTRGFDVKKSFKNGRNQVVVVNTKPN